ncbi:SH3 domain-containing protein [Rhizobium rhizogenes]|uniref:SH3 domain-containing protein n=1 Tax=Rhizobium rhizogenes TaxID=359 RepID=UPI0015720916|nr:SH3 domain-containing protein [Rhizobium rhizogenes]NTI78584.1 SH3 domain-containing protein [Rhizobium rhizogenes]
MSAPYRNFWIIVGMTAAAVIFANMSAKSKASRTAGYSGGNQPGQVNTPTSVITKSFEAASSTEPVTAPVSAPDNETTRQAPTAQSPGPERKFRIIDADIKIAFDAAVQVALATPSDKGDDKKNSDDEGGTSLPSLETKDIKAIPQVATAPAVPITPDPPNVEIAKTTTNLNMREGPGPQYVLVETLATGMSVVVIGTEAGWVHIRVKDSSREGWVNPRYLSKN